MSLRNLICFRCKSESHLLIPCDQVKKWVNEIINNQLDKLFFSKSNVEKIQKNYNNSNKHIIRRPKIFIKLQTLKQDFWKSLQIRLIFFAISNLKDFKLQCYTLDSTFNQFFEDLEKIKNLQSQPTLTERRADFFQRKRKFQEFQIDANQLEKIYQNSQKMQIECID